MLLKKFSSSNLIIYVISIRMWSFYLYYWINHFLEVYTIRDNISDSYFYIKKYQIVLCYNILIFILYIFFKKVMSCISTYSCILLSSFIKIIICYKSCFSVMIKILSLVRSITSFLSFKLTLLSENYLKEYPMGTLKLAQDRV